MNELTELSYAFRNLLHAAVKPLIPYFEKLATFLVERLNL